MSFAIELQSPIYLYVKKTNYVILTEDNKMYYAKEEV